MKTNITLKLDTDILRKARILAAEEGVLCGSARDTTVLEGVP
jgi:hypothetical protein